MIYRPHTFLPTATHVPSIDKAGLIDITLLLRRNPDTAPLTYDACARITHRMPADEFETAHGAHPSDIARVVKYVRSCGVEIVRVHRAAKQIKIRAPIAVFDAMFHVDIQQYEADGEVFRHHNIQYILPPVLTDVVEHVIGLDNKMLPLAKATERLPPNTTALTVDTVRWLYNYIGVPATDQTIGIFAYYKYTYNLPDIEAYFANSALTTAPMPRLVNVNEPLAPPADFAPNEGNLDVCVAGSAAPASQIAMYHWNVFDTQDMLNMYTRAIHPEPGDPVPSVLTTSYSFLDGNFTFLDSVFSDAAALGVTVCQSSGDWGAGVWYPSDGLAHVASSSPWVLSVGGTTVGNIDYQNKTFTEWYWHASNGGGGGGVSRFYPVPSYQSLNGINPIEINIKLPGRGVPDVALNASGYSGYLIPVFGEFLQINGTSGASPLMAGMIATINQWLGIRVGYINPIIYQYPYVNQTFYDIDTTTSGDKNSSVVQDSDGQAVTGYPVATGWDPCTGLGRPDGVKLMQMLRSALVVAPPPPVSNPPPAPPTPPPAPPVPTPPPAPPAPPLPPAPPPAPPFVPAIPSGPPAPPPAPVPTGPAINYRAQVKRLCDWAWTSTEAFRSDLTAMRITLQQLIPNTAYQIRVLANGSRYSPPTEIATAAVDTNPPSPDGTFLSDPTGTIRDNIGNVWALSADTINPYTISLNGNIDANVNNIIILLISGNRIYFETKSYSWFVSSEPLNQWIATVDPRQGVPPVIDLPTPFAATPVATTVVTYHGGPVLDSCQLSLIYWGSDWLSQIMMPSRTQTSTGITALVGSRYFTGLDEYGVQNPPILVNDIVTTSVALPALSPPVSPPPVVDPPAPPVPMPPPAPPPPSPPPPVIPPPAPPPPAPPPPVIPPPAPPPPVIPPPSPPPAGPPVGPVASSGFIVVDFASPSGNILPSTLFGSSMASDGPNSFGDTNWRDPNIQASARNLAGFNLPGMYARSNTNETAFTGSGPRLDYLDSIIAALPNILDVNTAIFSYSLGAGGNDGLADGSVSPDQYAAWAVQCAQYFDAGFAQLGLRNPVVQYEVMNEPDGRLDVNTYCNVFNATANALHQYNSTIMVGGPVVTDGGLAGDYIRTFAQNCPSADFVSWHAYYRDAGSFGNKAAGVRQLLQGTQLANVPTSMGEYNMEGDGTGISDQATMTGTMVNVGGLYYAWSNDPRTQYGAVWDWLGDSWYGLIGDPHNGNPPGVPALSVVPTGHALRICRQHIGGQHVSSSAFGAASSVGILATRNAGGTNFGVLLINFGGDASGTIALSSWPLNSTGTATIQRKEVSDSNQTGLTTTINVVNGLLNITLPGNSITILTP